MQWNVGDWVVLDMDVGQIKTSYADDCFSFSDGWSETSGSRIHERFRPLTLRSKRIVEHFKGNYILDSQQECRLQHRASP